MRKLLAALALAAAGLAAAQAPRAADRKHFSVVEASIADMRAALEQRRTSSHDIVQQYLARIAMYEDRLHAAIRINPHALEEADVLDRERRQGHLRGPLHGIPIALKDNIQTTTMPTTGGAMAFADFVPPYEATLTRNLREAGAIIIAKTAMTELANWVAESMPPNYSAIGGFGLNPYDARHDLRGGLADGRPVLSAGGSSSGAGTAANLWAANVGTETSGSILNPSNQNMLVGIKPTVGRISRYGVIPISADQDTPGPMAKTVADAALLLGVLEGAAPDSHDPAAGACPAPPNHDYMPFLRRDGLRGARIGIPRAYFYEGTTPPGTGAEYGGLTDEQAAVMEQAIATLKAQGAVIVDPANLPSITARDADRNYLLWPVCSGPQDERGRDEDCSVVLKYGMKRDFNAWLASLGRAAPVKSLEELRAWNRDHQLAGAIRYGQAQLDVSDQISVPGDRARYEADRAKDLRLTAKEGIDEVLREQHLDALLFPGFNGAALAARPGYPTVIVPFGLVANPARPDPNARPAPFGVSFTAGACSEPKLIELAYSFEQATRRRVPPPLD